MLVVCLVSPGYYCEVLVKRQWFAICFHLAHLPKLCRKNLPNSLHCVMVAFIANYSRTCMVYLDVAATGNSVYTVPGISCNVHLHLLHMEPHTYTQNQSRACNFPLPGSEQWHCVQVVAATTQYWPWRKSSRLMWCSKAGNLINASQWLWKYRSLPLPIPGYMQQHEKIKCHMSGKVSSRS